MIQLTFDIERLNQLRLQTQKITHSQLVQHTPQTLSLMRAAYLSNRSTTLSIVAGKLNRRSTVQSLSTERLAAVLAILRMCQARTVLDIGCGEGLLLRALSRQPYINKIVGVDLDPHQIKVAQRLTNANKPNKPVKFYCMDITKYKSTHLRGFDAVTLLEVVEHIPDRDWIRHVFALAPNLVIVTTPNYQFNSLRTHKPLCTNGLRHPDHVFEFRLNEFKTWAKKHGQHHGYSVSLLPLGPVELNYGSHGLMAIFQKSPLGLPARCG